MYLICNFRTMCDVLGGFIGHIKKIVFGASDKKRGFSSINETIIHPKTEVIKGILDELMLNY